VDEHAFIHRLRILHRISSATTTDDINRIDAALHFALDELGLDQGYLGAIDEQTNELVIENVVVRAGVPTYPPGKRYPLGETLLGHVVNADLVLAAPDVIKVRAEHGVRYSDEWKSFIAVAIRFGERSYGAIGFKGRTVRDVPFSQVDVEFVQITGDLIAASVQRRLQRDRLDALAFYDALTGLPNRVLLVDRLEQCIIRSKRSTTGFALLFLDLDGFKTINDEFGHAAGDDVLREFATRLARIGREGDTVARLGGDEFVVVAPNIETDRDARELAARLTQSTYEPVVVKGNRFALSVSIGIGMFPENGTDASTLLAYADSAMFAAKGSGLSGIGSSRGRRRAVLPRATSAAGNCRWHRRPTRVNR
jgi:diguanylate cyclase (GGDEF)-like protein